MANYMASGSTGRAAKVITNQQLEEYRVVEANGDSGMDILIDGDDNFWIKIPQGSANSQMYPAIKMV